MSAKWEISTNTRNRPYWNMFASAYKVLHMIYSFLVNKLIFLWDYNHLKLLNSCWQIMNKLCEKLNSTKTEIFSSANATNSHNFMYCVRICVQKSIERFCWNFDKMYIHIFTNSNILALNILKFHLNFYFRPFQFTIEHFKMHCQANTNDHNKNIDEIPHKSGIFTSIAK